MDIVQHPAEVLLKPTIPIPDGQDMRQFAGQMVKAMEQHKGIGLAANQIGSRWRMAVVAVPGWPRFVMLNPQIVRTKGEQTRAEGCLSVFRSNYRLQVTRAATVWVEFTDLDGKRQTLKAKELLARCIQHEIDHLNGMTCIERTSA